VPPHGGGMGGLMDFKQMEAFVNVIKYRSFSKAADASFLTQPTISTHVNTLEKELGVLLVDRQPKEALPTKQGQIFYEYALNMLHTREQATFALNTFSQKVGGILEIQTSSIPGQYLLPKLMREFQKQYENVRYYLEQSDSSIVIENIKAQKGEIGFTGMKNDDGMTYTPLMQDKVVLLTPKNQKFENLTGKRLNIKDFIGEGFVWREQGSGTRLAFENHIKHLGYDPKSMNIIARMNSMEAIKQAVSYGLGVSIVSEISIPENIENETYMAFPIEEFQVSREFYLVCNHKVSMSPTAEIFKNFTLDYFQFRRMEG